MVMDARWTLLTRCLTEAINSRREQTRMPNPFFSEGYLEDVWTVCQEFYDGRQWERLGTLPTWKSRPVAGKSHQGVEAYTTQLTDAKPKAGFYPREVDDEPLAKLVQAYFDYWWEMKRGATALYLAVKDSRKFGVGWLHLEWDKAKKEQCIYAIHPEAVFVDPDCTADDFDPTYLIYEYVAQVGDLKAAYPNAEWDEFNHTQDQSLAAGLFDRILKRIGIGNTNAENPAKSAVVYELWLKDPETIEWEVYDKELDAQVTKRNKKYKNGRVITCAGGIVLSDEESPYNHGKFPFVPIHAYPESGKFYNKGDIALIMADEMLLNRVNQLLMDGTLKASGGIYLVNSLMGLTKHSITNDPVQVREVKDVNAALRVVQPPTPPRHLFDFGTYLSRTIDDKLGIHDISRGVFTPGNKTVAEVDVLSESDKTRVRMAARFLAQSISVLGHQWLSNVAQFEDRKQVLRVSDDTTGEMQSVEANLSKELKFGKDWLSPLDIIVADDSTLPAVKREREQLALELHARQAIDNEDLLETVDWPTRKKVMQRMSAPQAAPQGALPPGAPPEGMPPNMPPGMPPEGMAPEGMPLEGMPPGMTPEIMMQMMQMMGGQPEVPPDLPPELMALIASQSAPQGVEPL